MSEADINARFPRTAPDSREFRIEYADLSGEVEFMKKIEM